MGNSISVVIDSENRMFSVYYDKDTKGKKWCQIVPDGSKSRIVHSTYTTTVSVVPMEEEDEGKGQGRGG